ncbi:hypothetical protein Tco_1446198 [Tanacetum coccineum]
MANEANKVRDAIIRRLRTEQEKEYQLVNNLFGEITHYMVQKLDRAEEETRVMDMPEQIRVGEFSPPYYISQLGDSLIISRNFGFGNCRIIYAWALEVEGGFVSSYRLLFTIPYPTNRELKLLGFSKDKEPIVEALIV